MSAGATRWSLRTQLIVVAVLALFIWAFNVAILSPVRFALDNERRIHAGYLVLKLVDAHVRNSSNWPRSWNDLEKIGPDSSGMFQWPEDREVIERLIQVDFHPDLPKLMAVNREMPPAVRAAGVDVGWISDHYWTFVERWKNDKVWSPPAKSSR